MDISFRLEDRRFNYRVSAMLLSGTRILAVHDERSPYFSDGSNWGKRQSRQLYGRLRKSLA